LPGRGTAKLNKLVIVDVMKKFERLSRNEMKNVLGGNPVGGGGGGGEQLYSGGSCSGGVGTWFYPDGPVYAQTCTQTIISYCSSGEGTCTYASGDL
jgi:hypothetical protein